MHEVHPAFYLDSLLLFKCYVSFIYFLLNKKPVFIPLIDFVNDVKPDIVVFVEFAPNDCASVRSLVESKVMARFL